MIYADQYITNYINVANSVYLACTTKMTHVMISVLNGIENYTLL